MCHCSTKCLVSTKTEIGVLNVDQSGWGAMELHPRGLQWNVMMP